jgi:hypothetical protein
MDTVTSAGRCVYHQQRSEKTAQCDRIELKKRAETVKKSSARGPPGQEAPVERDRALPRGASLGHPRGRPQQNKNSDVIARTFFFVSSDIVLLQYGHESRHVVAVPSPLFCYTSELLVGQLSTVNIKFCPNELIFPFRLSVFSTDTSKAHDELGPG